MLAVFPLNITILPEESVALHLFEPRYKELFADHKNGKEFVILFSEKGKLSDYGTIVFIEQVINEYPDGTVDLIVKGRQIVKIESFYQLFPTKLYSGVDVRRVELFKEANPKLAFQFDLFLEMENRKKDSKGKIFSIYNVANRLKMPLESKNEFISIEQEAQANIFLINEIKFLQKIREQEFSLNQNFHLN